MTDSPHLYRMKRYRMTIAGPDDVHEFDHEIEALRMANKINKQYLEDRLKHPNDEVLCVATVSQLPDPGVVPKAGQK